MTVVVRYLLREWLLMFSNHGQAMAIRVYAYVCQLKVN